MATQVIAPREGGDSGSVLVSWKRAVGDRVEPGDELGTVETDKATMDIMSPGSGVVLALLYAEGEEIPPSAPVAIVGEEGEDISFLLSRETTEAAGGVEQHLPEKPIVEMGFVYSSSVKATPKAKKYAREHGIALDGIPGTGVGGSICFRDVRSKTSTAGAEPAAESIAESEPQNMESNAASPVSDNARRISLSGFQPNSATRMMQSLHRSAQFTLHSEVNADALVKLRSRFKSSDDPDICGITVGDMLMFAAARVLPRHPALNAVFSGGALTQYETADLAFALDTQMGLLMPVLRGAQKLSLRELSRRIAEMTAKGRAGMLGSEEVSGGSFTVSNLGSMGITYFTPILNPPQAGLLGIGKIRTMPQYHNGEVRFENVLSLSLTLDHQAVDGATGARFLADLSGFIADFDLLALK